MVDHRFTNYPSGRLPDYDRALAERHMALAIRALNRAPDREKEIAIRWAALRRAAVAAAYSTAPCRRPVLVWGK